MPFATGSFLLLIVMPGATSSVIASSDALVTNSNGLQLKSNGHVLPSLVESIEHH